MYFFLFNNVKLVFVFLIYYSYNANMSLAGASHTEIQLA